MSNLTFSQNFRLFFLLLFQLFLAESKVSGTEEKCYFGFEVGKNVIRGVITTKATKAAALVVFWDYIELSLADLKEKNIFIILPSIKNSLNMLGLLCRFEEINVLSFHQA